MSPYANRFKSLLVEKDDTINTDLSDDQVAMQHTLDKGTDVSDFDVKNLPQGTPGEPTMGGMQKKMYDELKTWVGRLDEFSGFLNGTNPDSVQSRLNSAESDTLFDKISTAETKKIARVAVEISSLSEMLKGYLATANDPKYRYS